MKHALGENRTETWADDLKSGYSFYTSIPEFGVGASKDALERAL